MRSMVENKRTGGRLIIHNRSCPPLILTPGGQICWESDRHPMILKARLISNYYERLPLKTRLLVIQYNLPGLFPTWRALLNLRRAQFNTRIAGNKLKN
jgi:hypothetical protein